MNQGLLLTVIAVSTAGTDCSKYIRIYETLGVHCSRGGEGRGGGGVM